MLFNALAVSSLLVALVAAEPTPYKLVAKMSLNQAFGLMGRDTAGYQPTQQYCGPGQDCPSSCGAGYVMCPSKDKLLHCFNQPAGELCCPDGSGSSCDKGYFCTADSHGSTWCCPDGMSLTACAASYHLTGALVSQTTPANYPTATSVQHNATTHSSSYTTSSCTTTVASITPVNSANVTTSKTATKTASATLSTFTAGADRVVLSGFGGLVLAAGALLAF